MTGINFALLYVRLPRTQGHPRAGRFRKVGESLYTYSSNKIYYAVFRSLGKLIWKSLQTADRALANRKLKQELECPHVDVGLRKLSSFRHGHRVRMCASLQPGV